MAYQVNTGIGAVAGVQTFVLDGLATNAGGATSFNDRRGPQSRGRSRARAWWLVLLLLQHWM